jgi:hypothetical protein
VDIVFPTVVDATQATLLVSPEEQVRAAMCTGSIQKSNLSISIPEKHKVLAQNVHAYWRAVRAWDLFCESDREPIPPK